MKSRSGNLIVMAATILMCAANAVALLRQDVEAEPQTKPQEMRWYADNSDHYYTNYEDYMRYRAERDAYLAEQEKEEQALLKAVERSWELMEAEQESGAVFTIYTQEECWTCEYDITPEELEEESYWDGLELAACVVEAEAGNQGLEGMRLVADVIFNRVRDKDFPDTVQEVIMQPGQFATWENGMIDKVEPSENAYKAVQMEMEKQSYPSLIYFSAEGYLPYGTPWRKIGDHYFSTK